MSCNCNKPKCDGKCGISPSVLQINNPGDCTLFHRVEVPASMGDSITNPPKNGDYHNVLLYYVADGTSWLFSSDGIPQKLVSGFTDYEDAINLPSINGVTLFRDKTGEELGLQDKLTAGDGIEISSNNIISVSDIEQYAHFFDTLADMKNAENLVDGSYARTIGYETVNDGGGCIYRVRTRTISDQPNDSTIVAIGDSLVGVLVYTEDYLPLSFTHVKYEGSAPVKTDVWYSIIPSDFQPDLYIANGTVGTTEEPSHNALENKTTLSINAGFTTGIIIKDGIVRQEQLAEGDARFDDIYMTYDGTLNSVDSFTSTEDILALSPKWAAEAWKPIVKDGVDLSGGLGTDYNPRTFIGQDAEGNYIVGVCNGRSYDSYGLNMADIKDFVESVGFTPYFLFNLDGGGSSSMVVRGQRVNSLVGYENRAVPSYIGFRSKYAKNNSVFESNYVSSLNKIRREQSFEPQRADYMATDRIVVPAETSAVVTLQGQSRMYIVNNLAVLNIRFRISGDDPLAKYKPIVEGLPRARNDDFGLECIKLDDNSSHYLYMTQNADDITSTLRNGGKNTLPTGDYVLNVTYPFQLASGSINLS